MIRNAFTAWISWSPGSSERNNTWPLAYHCCDTTSLVSCISRIYTVDTLWLLTIPPRTKMELEHGSSEMLTGSSFLFSHVCHVFLFYSFLRLGSRHLFFFIILKQARIQRLIDVYRFSPRSFRGKTWGLKLMVATPTSLAKRWQNPLRMLKCFWVGDLWVSIK